MAGSIRIPSLCCGTYGFKPTSGRVPFSGQTSTSLPGLPGLQSCAGPMATTLADLSLLFTAVLGARPWTHDAQAMPVPFQTSAAAAFDAKPVLRIGLLPVDPAEPLHPPVKRALANAVAALVAAGHTVVPVALGPYTSVDAAAKAAFGFFAIDPTHTSMRNIQASGEPMIKTVAEKPSKAAASILERTYDVADVAALHDQRMRFQDAWRALFEENALDAVIGPGAQHTATKHDTYGMPSYTVIWNLVDVRTQSSRGGRRRTMKKDHAKGGRREEAYVNHTVPCVHNPLRHSVKDSRSDRVSPGRHQQPQM